MSRPDRNRNRHLSSLLLPLLLAGLITQCGDQEDADPIASFRDESLTVADLDAYLLTLPAPQRQIPPGEEREDWLEAKIRRLALERILLASDEMAELEADPDLRAVAEQMRESQLASALLAELARDIEPTAVEIAAKVDELAAKRQPRLEPILNFQHIFFRLDRGNPEETKARAEQVAISAAVPDADFPALAREHSDSADAAAGGLVQNVRPSDLDSKSAAALAALEEGEVSPLIETRTGLHLFRLIRRLEPEASPTRPLEAEAREALLRERLHSARTTLVAELRTAASEGTDGEELSEQELLAREAAARGLATPELEERIEATLRLQQLERLFSEHRRRFDAELGEERLRPFYDAQPSTFSTPERTHVELIFVPQGSDSFATQKRLEQRVAELRRGGPFSEMARSISQGPGAEEGGDLGLLTADQLARYGPVVANAVPQLEVGEISDPVYCTGRVLTRDPLFLRGGFAILRIGERQPPQERSFEEAIADVRLAYALQHRRDLDLELEGRILQEAGFRLLRLPQANEFLQ